jgi:uncharacterized membrane protein
VHTEHATGRRSKEDTVESLLHILGDLAVLGSIALLLWGVVLCAMLELGETRRERRAGERFHRRGVSEPRMDHRSETNQDSRIASLG